MIPEILEQWAIIDRWWTLEPTQVEYAEVDWDGRRLVMVRRDPETTWRIQLGLG